MRRRRGLERALLRMRAWRINERAVEGRDGKEDVRKFV